MRRVEMAFLRSKKANERNNLKVKDPKLAKE
jgi:hypothetical protein